MAIIINGDGHNSSIILKKIHEGNGSFRKDSNTVHGQVKLMQSALTTLNYDTQGADGIFGDNTLSAVKRFQSANGLSADGYFGKNSLLKLEELIGGHLDAESDCADTNIVTTGGGLLNAKITPFTDTIESISGETYKTMTGGARVNTLTDACASIRKYKGVGTPITVDEYIAELKRMAIEQMPYLPKKCAGYTLAAKNNQGYNGATTNFTKHCAFFGHINDLGGYQNLIRGMELYKAVKKKVGSNYFYSWHTGVYAGMYDFGNGPEPAVYHCTENNSSLRRIYEDKDNGGANLTSMASNWNYWGWSKYVIGE